MASRRELADLAIKTPYPVKKVEAVAAIFAEFVDPEKVVECTEKYLEWTMISGIDPTLVLAMLFQMARPQKQGLEY